MNTEIKTREQLLEAIILKQSPKYFLEGKSTQDNCEKILRANINLAELNLKRDKTEARAYLNDAIKSLHTLLDTNQELTKVNNYVGRLNTIAEKTGAYLLGAEIYCHPFFKQ